MSAIVHAQVQVHAQVRNNAHVEVRDHRVEPERQTRPVQSDRSDRSDRSERSDRWDRSDRSSRIDRDDRGHTRPVFGRPIIRTTPVYLPPPVYTSWTPAPSYTYQPAAIQVLGATALANDQLSIDVGSLGNATTLELDAAGGSTFVSQVTVIFDNGAYQVIPVNQMLSAQNPSIPLSIDNGADVSRIVVDGHSQWNGALSIRAL